MNRRDFIKVCQLLGISLPLQAVPHAQGGEQSNSSTKPIIIIGAGAAGLTAGYLLKQLGMDFLILEASANYGGRMKRTADFADFPIPLGAEWIHVKPSILQETVNDESVEIDIQTTRYDQEQDYAVHAGEELSISAFGMSKESKFINATWFDFFEQYIVPSVSSHIVFNSPIEEIDYSTDAIGVKTAEQNYVADKVIVSVPVKMLQMGAIKFVPELPSYKRKAIEQVSVWDGCKAFIEFSEKFYPAFVGFEVERASAGHRMYYDAAYGQNTEKNILGLFSVGSASHRYLDLKDDELIAYILNEIDELSDGQASRHYVKHIFQNWNKEPFIRGTYVMDVENWNTVRKLGKSVDNRLFFAGDAYTRGDDWSSVHSAVRSAKRAVNRIT